MSDKYSFTQNRELSWLKFDLRVLEEALDDSVPLLERLKFVSIFTSNLDEFYMVRCGTLDDLALIDETYKDNKSGMSAKEQLNAIFEESTRLYKIKDDVYNEVESKLREKGIFNLSYDELNKKDIKFLNRYYENYILPVISPQIIDFQHPFPHLKSKILTIVLIIEKNKKKFFAFVKVLSSLKRVIKLPGKEFRYMLVEELILEHVDEIFSGYNVVFKTIISVTRNADISINNDQVDLDVDYRGLMRNVLKKRSRLAPVRLEFYQNSNEKIVKFLMDKLDLERNQVQISNTPLEMNYVFDLIHYIKKCNNSLYHKLTYSSFKENYPPYLRKDQSIFSQIKKRDFLFFYPYESMDNFLKLIKEAANDKKVASIKITIYRLAEASKLVHYLLEALENGVEVTALMELRARFDEKNNIKYAEILEDAGCNVIYGFEKYKVHSKVCLITRKTFNGFEYFTQLGTGNYNEKTSKTYTDFSYLTARHDIGQDALFFFQNLAIGNINGKYKKLLVSPTSFKQTISKKIKNQIEIAEKGEDAYILMKMNSLTDIDLINLLQKASQAGVKIDLIIRSITCLKPQIPNLTENIRIRSIVGRFLEHPRAYCFGIDEDMEIYLASADLMTRNTENRVEVAFPIEDDSLKLRIRKILNVQLADNLKARNINSNGDYEKIPIEGEAIDSQDYFITHQFYSKPKKIKNKSFLTKLKEKLS